MPPKHRGPLKTGHGVLRGLTPVVDPDIQFKNGLASVWVGPFRNSDTIHRVTIPSGDTILCMPNVPAGRLVPRPEATEPTCDRPGCE